MSPDDYLRQRLEHHLENVEGQEELIALLLPLLAMGARQSAATWQGLRDEVAQALVLALKDDAERHWRISWDGSLERANQIIAVGEARADLAIQALGTMAKADALKFVTGRLEEAWELLEHAGQLYRMSHLPENEREIGWARTRIGRVYICTEVGKIEQGFVEAEQALVILEREQAWGRVIMLRNCWARTLDILNLPQRSIKQYEMALGVVHHLNGDEDSYLRMLYHNMAIAQRALGQVTQASVSYQKVATLFERNGEIGASALARHNLAILYMESGQFVEALRLFYEVEPILRDNLPRNWIGTLHGLMRCYGATNRWRELRVIAQKLLDIENLSSSDLLLTYYNYAWAELMLGNLDLGQAMLEKALDLALNSGTLSWIARIRLRQAELYLSLQRYPEAQSLAEASAAQWQAEGYTYYVLAARLVEAEANLAEGTIENAYQAGRSALQLAKQEKSVTSRYKAHLVLGRIAEAQGNRTSARRYYRTAEGVAERLHRGLSHTLTADVMQQHEAAFHHLMRLELGDKKPNSALELLENHKNRLFFRYLQQANRLQWTHNTITLPLIEALDGLRIQYSQAIRLLEEKPDYQMKSEIFEIENRIRAVTDQLYLYCSREQLGAEVGLLVEQIQAMLQPDHLVLQYYDQGDSLWCFVISNETVVVHQLDKSRRAIEMLIEQLQQNIQSTVRFYLPDDSAALIQRKKFRAIAGELGKTLLAPVIPCLSRIQRLYIVPFGLLHTVPFNILNVQGASLIEQCEIVMLPTTSILLHKPLPYHQGLRWIGYSWEGRLPIAISEVERFHSQWGGALYTEGSATLNALAGSTGQVLHLSTHGVHRVDQHFDLSFLTLADRNLYEDDLLQMQLRYELITLSSCETAVVKVAPGDELIGLGRGFLFGGAGAFLASLWQVREEITTQLMDCFYHSLFRGVTKAGALQYMQTKLLSDYPKMHPAYWGAFQLVGNGDALNVPPSIH